MPGFSEADILKSGKLVGDAGVTDAPAVATPKGGLTEDDIIANGKQISAGGISPSPTASNGGFMSQLGRQLGLTARYALEGTGGVLDIGATPIAALLNEGSKAVGSNQRFYGSTTAMKSLADYMGLPNPSTPLERVVGEGTRQGFGAMIPVAGAENLAKNALSPVTKNVAGLFAANPGVQVASGAIGGGAGQTATELGFTPEWAAATNLGASLLANSVGQRVANANAGKYTPQGTKAMALNEAAKKEGVNLSAGDLGNRTAQVIENFTQDLPGTGRDAFMQKQATQTQAMLRRLESETESAVAPGEKMIGALRNQYNNNRAAADNLYSAVKTDLAKVPGSEQIDMSTFANKAKEFLSQYPKYLESPDVSESVKATLKAARDGSLTSLPYQNARDLGTLIGNEARSAARQGKPISGELDQLYKNLKIDLSAWAHDLKTVNPDAATSYSKADIFYKDNVLPFKQRSGPLAKVKDVVSPKASQDELAVASDRIMNALFQSNKPNTAEAAMRLSGPQGAQAAQEHLLGKALGAGLDERTKAGVSPMRFVNTLNLEDPMVQQVLAKDTDLANRLRTVNDIAQATRRSVSAFETPRTGNQNKAVAALVGLVNPTTSLQTATGLIGGRTADWALHTDPVKGLLFAQPANPYTYMLPSINSLINSGSDK